MLLIDIGEVFSKYPAGRHPQDGKYNGETFRKKFLEEPLSQSQKVTIEFDKAVSYGSSFLEEAFGGLVRTAKFDNDTIKSIELVSADSFLIDEIKTYINDAINGL